MIKIKSIAIGLLTAAVAICSFPAPSFAAGGIYASGGGAKRVGDTFTVTVKASGVDFNSLQGTISVSGPVSIVTFSPGSATWLPGQAPSNGNQFVGITNTTSSLTVATIKLKATNTGSGSVNVSGVKLARTDNGVPSVVGTGAGGTSFTIDRALVIPGAVTVSSDTHPDQNTAYEATTVTLSWGQGNASGFAYSYDQVADTDPGQTVTGNIVTITYENLPVGSYYFHIRPKNNDGWGPVTHFKFTIKEPDPKINESLGKPHDLTVVKLSDYVNNVTDGTFSGWSVSGVTEPNFVANIILDPVPTLPEGTVLSATADAEGKFTYLFNFPIKAGSYRLNVQGQSEKILTPVSDPISVEISQKSGGAVNVITSSDEFEPIIPEKKWWEKINYQILAIGLGALVVIFLGFIVFLLVAGRSVKKNLRNLMEKVNLK